MISIEFHASVCKIFDMEMSNLTRLKDKMVYYDAGVLYATKNYFAARRYLLNKDGVFPCGLLKRVEDWLNKEGLEYKVYDMRRKPKLKSLGLTQLALEPEAYIDQYIARDNCAKSIQGRGIVVMPTGVGKTRVIKDLILSLDTRALIVPPSTNLRKQLFEYLTECFGSKYVEMYDKSVGCIKPISIANIDAMGNARAHHFDNVDCLIIDEFHHAGATGYREYNELLWHKIPMKFGFTATNFRNDKNEQILLESILSEEVFHMSPVEAIEKKYIVPIQPIMYTIKNEGMSDSSHYASAYKKFIACNDERNDKIAEIANSMVANKIPTLIIVKQVEHGKLLASKVNQAIFVNGQDEDSDYNMRQVKKFNDLNLPCLIGTSVIGEGVDTKSAGCVILANGEKAPSRVQQNIGRAIRNFPGKKVGYVIDFYDENSKFMKRHSKARQKIYRDVFGVEAKLFD